MYASKTMQPPLYETLYLVTKSPNTNNIYFFIPSHFNMQQKQNVLKLQIIEAIM